ncbi:hypothetical protein JVU11DRAFT_441 [Chiua virens]|nr:hypothetical protein JVU11DRAFT_441 [Chiua virens]
MSLFFRHRPTAEVNFSVRTVDEATAGDTVLVSRPIWDALCFSSESRMAVSIKSTRQYSTGSLADHISALTCWAVYDPTVSEIAVPPAWLTTYPTIFQPSQITLHGSSKSVILSPVEDLTLTEFVLTAKHEEAYVAASVHGAVLENWFFESHIIVRDGEEVSVPSGFFSVSGLSTRISSSYLRYTVSLALPYKQGVAQRGSTAFIVMSSNEADEVSDGANGAPGQENLEISESFLMSATLSSPEPFSRANESVKAPGVVFSVDTLRSPIDADLDQVTVYVCASSLRPLGVLNGDWALASPVGSSSSRLVRIGALDAAFNGSRKCSALLSPILLHNLCPRGASQIVLRASPYGARDPGVTTAKSITLARVASPFSINRRYEPLFIDALHKYFGSSKRLVKDGDIIPLRIDVDRSLDPQSVIHSGDFKRAVMHNYSYVPVYFVIRNVDYESFTAQTDGQPFSVPDIGCFINIDITKVIQVGVEHIEVPDVYRYYELGHVRSALPVATGISRQVVQLSNAMSLDETTFLSARPTVFITGGRGTGKFSAALCIAHRLQMHLVEINCFCSLSDTVVKTESLLREQVETAIACSPCLVVLRHIDALRHTSTAVNANEGSPLLRTLLEWVDDLNKTRGKQCILLGIAEQGKSIDDISFSNEIEIKALSEEERFDLLLAQVNSQDGLLASDVSLASLAKQTAALVASDLASLVHKTCLCAVMDSDQWKLATQPVISTKQFNTALLKARSTFAQSIGVPSIPTVFWEDIGGLDSVKNEILDTVQLPLDHPQLFQDGLKKRSGILLYGPPGTWEDIAC